MPRNTAESAEFYIKSLQGLAKESNVKHGKENHQTGWDNGNNPGIGNCLAHISRLIFTAIHLTSSRKMLGTVLLLDHNYFFP
jgi:hypothetical protein